MSWIRIWSQFVSKNSWSWDISIVVFVCPRLYTLTTTLHNFFVSHNMCILIPLPSPTSHITGSVTQTSTTLNSTVTDDNDCHPPHHDGPQVNVFLFTIVIINYRLTMSMKKKTAAIVGSGKGWWWGEARDLSHLESGTLFFLFYFTLLTFIYT
jgi:hypothetical protein